jgi:hypothetical protein
MHSVSEEVSVDVHQDVARQVRRNVKVVVLSRVFGGIAHSVWSQSFNQVGIWVMLNCICDDMIQQANTGWK